MNMQDIHQSPLYSQFIKKIGWIVENIDGINIFIKKFPLFPAVIKIQRSDKLPDSQKLKSLMQKYSAKSITIEPNIDYLIQDTKYKILNTSFLPTKTIYIDLTPSESEIFSNFSPAKRKAIRRAQNLGVKIIQSNNIEDFIKLKNKSAGFLGFLTTQTLKPLWQTFAPNNAFILLAKSCHCEESEGRRGNLINSIRRSPLRQLADRDDSNIIAGVLILIWNKTAYYWIAASSNAGKKSFAPSLLIWESLKKAKSMGATNFDFEGIFDERYPKLNRDWSGFSKFKSGFGGKEIHFPPPFKILNTNY